jgi:RHS repeat-associated protein
LPGLCTSFIDSRYKFKGNELEDDLGLNWVHFPLRRYDPQLGRWTGVDPYDECYSPYVYCGGNPVNYSDPTGGNLVVTRQAYAQQLREQKDHEGAIRQGWKSWVEFQAKQRGIPLPLLLNEILARGADDLVDIITYRRIDPLLAEETTNGLSEDGFREEMLKDSWDLLQSPKQLAYLEKGFDALKAEEAIAEEAHNQGQPGEFCTAGSWFSSMLSHVFFNAEASKQKVITVVNNIMNSDRKHKKANPNGQTWGDLVPEYFTQDADGVWQPNSNVVFNSKPRGDGAGMTTNLIDNTLTIHLRNVGSRRSIEANFVHEYQHHLDGKSGCYQQAVDLSKRLFTDSTPQVCYQNAVMENRAYSTSIWYAKENGQSTKKWEGKLSTQGTDHYWGPYSYFFKKDAFVEALNPTKNDVSLKKIREARDEFEALRLKWTPNPNVHLESFNYPFGE